MVLFDAGEDARSFFKGGVHVLGPLNFKGASSERRLRVAEGRKERRTRERCKKGKTEKKGKGSGKGGSSSSSIDDDCIEEPDPKGSPSSVVTTSPTGTPVEETTIRDSVSVMTLHPTSVPTSTPTRSPVAALVLQTDMPSPFPTKFPTDSLEAEAVAYDGPCVCTFVPEKFCTECKGRGEECVGDCTTIP